MSNSYETSRLNIKSPSFSGSSSKSHIDLSAKVVPFTLPRTKLLDAKHNTNNKNNEETRNKRYTTINDLLAKPSNITTNNKKNSQSNW